MELTINAMHLQRIVNVILWQRWKNLDMLQHQILRKNTFPVFHVPRTASGPTIFQASHIRELKYYVTISEKKCTLTVLTQMSPRNSILN